MLVQQRVVDPLGRDGERGQDDGAVSLPLQQSPAPPASPAGQRLDRLGQRSDIPGKDELGTTRLCREQRAPPALHRGSAPAACYTGGEDDPASDGSPRDLDGRLAACLEDLDPGDIDGIGKAARA